ncbi:hypothetical protein RFI_08600 [Reticulomyxa filosa]|uniref:Uncharacterized protein n=1 Tax=Reticulomyxa filosa TaxID=46433 RepID=X6NRH1_RETFI|nr:hypothetical protein RFI_08600 [Reticulomyxa filosa]|eukprot:ETO28533.1 hypothetical protein RFI_08600 [Reticulomyxa filosa]
MLFFFVSQKNKTTNDHGLPCKLVIHSFTCLIGCRFTLVKTKAANKNKRIEPTQKAKMDENEKKGGYIAPQANGKSRGYVYTIMFRQQKYMNISLYLNNLKKGMYEKFDPMVDMVFAKEYCSALQTECVGIAHNKDSGYQFYSNVSYPLTENAGWTYYLKYDTQTPWSEIFNSLEEKGLDYNRMETDLIIDDRRYVLFSNDCSIRGFLLETKPETKVEKPHSAKSWTKGYMGYSMNFGRINNQLFSFEAMIQYCVFYNRTLIIPWPRHDNHVMGFESGMWDLRFLSLKVDFVLEHQLPQHLKGYHNIAKDDPCRVHKLIGSNILPRILHQCEMIYLSEGEFGIFKFFFFFFSKQ